MREHGEGVYDRRLEKSDKKDNDLPNHPGPVCLCQHRHSIVDPCSKAAGIELACNVTQSGTFWRETFSLLDIMQVRREGANERMSVRECCCCCPIICIEGGE